MTRFVVDSTAVLQLAGARISVPRKHELLAPTLLRSQTLSALHQAVHRGDLAAEEARDLLTRVGPPGMKIRLLGDAVLRRVAWDLADQLGWASTYDAEYLALTRLQADAFVTLDRELAHKVEGIVPLASLDALREVTRVSEHRPAVCTGRTRTTSLLIRSRNRTHHQQPLSLRERHRGDSKRSIRSPAN